MQLQNGHAWAPADLSRVMLRFSRRLDAGDDGNEGDAGLQAGKGPALRLVSEFNFAEQQVHDPNGCAGVLGTGSVAPGSVLTLWRGARCSFAFVPLRKGDRVQLMFGVHLPRALRPSTLPDLPSTDSTVIDDHTVDTVTQEPANGEAAQTSRVRERRLAADAGAATSTISVSGSNQQVTTQDLAAAFASFTVAGVAMAPTQLAASTASIVAPRRTADAGQGELRTASAPAAPPPVEQSAALPPSSAADDAAAQAAYARMLADWNAQQAAMAAEVRA